MFNSVLVVCVGNICRSPVGERLLARELPAVRVTSAGLGAVVGSGADDVAMQVAATHGLSLDGHVARQVMEEIVGSQDLILVMEKSHKVDLVNRFPKVSGKTMLFGQWLDGYPDVPDPYKRPLEFHEKTFALLEKAASSWIERLKR